MSALSQSITESIQADETRNEVWINYFRFALLSAVLLVDTVLYLRIGEEFAPRFIFGTATVTAGMTVSGFFIFYMKYRPFSPAVKYILTTSDFAFIAAFSIIIKMYSGSLFASTADVPALYVVFLVNSLSGLRYSFRLPLYCAALSFAIIAGVYLFDLVWLGTVNRLTYIRMSYSIMFMVSSALVSGFVGIRARDMVIRSVSENEDMNLARRIQRNSLPESDPVRGGAAFHSLYRPMKKIGGDFYDYITFDDPARTGIIIGDVSGHGVPAALIVSMIKALINNAGKSKDSPGQLLAYLNSGISGITGGNFFTAFYGIYDSSTREFIYARGGHCFPYLIRPGAEISMLKSSGRFLGLIHPLEFEEQTCRLESGDRLIMYTDGLIEETNPDGDEFGETLESEVLPGLAAEPVDDIVESLYKSLTAFHGSERFEDDVCIVGMSVR